MKKAVIILLLLPAMCTAQYNQMARNAFICEPVQQAFDFWNIAKPTTSFHSAFKPYLSSTFLSASDTAVPFRFYAFKNYFLSKTVNENPRFRNWVNVQAHPILDLETGYDMLLQKPRLTAIGGTHLKANINNDFTFAASVFGGKSQLPFYVDTVLAQSRILPEYGQAYGKYVKGYSFFDYTGYLSYSPKNNGVFNFQLGRDKHFIGDGHRSLLLSDVAAAYPYFRINANIWRFQYNVWYTWMYDVTNSGGIKKDFKNKYGTFHYLSYNISKNLCLGLFENIIWRGTDTSQVRGFEVNYLNPIIFFRPQEYAIGSPDNSFIGANLSANLFNRVKLYGQLAIDEFLLKELRARRGWWGNKQGWQLGAKYINALGVKGLKLQAEYNLVRPYTYTHGAVEQNYAHYGMPLAHPLGANFKEALFFASLRRNSWELSLQLMNAVIGKDTSNTKSNIGQNIFLSYNTRSQEYNNKTGQGIKTNILQSHLRFTYFLVPDMNMRLELGYVQRSEENSRGYQIQNPYIYFAFKTSFWNIYRDF